MNRRMRRARGLVFLMLAAGMPLMMGTGGSYTWTAEDYAAWDNAQNWSASGEGECPWPCSEYDTATFPEKESGAWAVGLISIIEAESLSWITIQNSADFSEEEVVFTRKVTLSPSFGSMSITMTDGAIIIKDMQQTY
ncbi:hypothetical protein RAS1_00720 [Phycisphaerae bacterium RAS1]|nr:hypothetical protein RAS1_00720 [Phycisphaerae bacterium RAS1]